ncbi:MAG: hypothetical protein COT91_02540 [Candidatus Doudnabacteria bacterium CG10_big_fil_rev_8_21_14_0_10_41_10]|uniref:Peptidase S11 D-alanyl-D-alanine carboxypeptidase A N-terminal domain-containing protein n=1 Tax=Candidatus Doudnabacteria bacterium CG10_big_fil_rev_8_21_14_0_10_41_10 TaxID=1974551 RepID=A0A2H0VDP7_9BACT|nr:MAG: hypothetical protein COT91_02540 [Candidatus Doudnabacteria bacterium CG10_big_fil_rev_8_21_14_0_10_41_10]
MSEKRQLAILWISTLSVVAAIFFPVRQNLSEQAPVVSGVISSLPVVEEPIPKRIGEGDNLDLEAPIALAIDLNSQKILFEKNIDEFWHPASLTKLMTAIVVLNTVSFDEVVEIEAVDTDVAQPKMGLVIGERVTVETLLKGMLIASANDAANTLARVVTGSPERFVDLMNLMGKQLQLNNTRFKNTTGFDSDGQLTTAWDLKTLVFEFLKNEKLASIVQIDSTVVQSVDGGRRHWLTSSNKLVTRENILGVKTGFTEEALGNLIILAQDHGNQILTVVLGSNNREAETLKLIDWVFSNYTF